MTKAGLAILICEWISIHFLFKKYFGRSVGVSVEEFISRASFSDVLLFTIHARNGFIGFCLMTMGKLFP